MTDKSNGIEYFICDDGHVHLTFFNENGEKVFETAMDVDFWEDLANDIDDEIDLMCAAEEAKEAVIH